MTIYRALHVHPQADVQVCVDQLFFKRAESGCGIKHSGVCTSRYKEGQGVVGEGGRKDADSCRQGGSS